MAARANWFVEPPALDDEPDLFAAPIEEIGERLDLRDPDIALQLKLTELLHREASLDAAGVTCAVKARADSSCHACPISQAHDRECVLGVLCRIGREQERVATEMAVRSCRDE